LQQVEGPILLHVVLELQVTRHGHLQRLGFNYWLLRQKKCVERGVGFDKLPLEDAQNNSVKIVPFLTGFG
jgi:hypothetical protein